MSNGTNSSNVSQSKTVLSAVLKKVLPKQKKSGFSIADTVENTNPNYGKGPKYSKNCQRVVYAAELRRRGFDVEAIERVLNGQDPFISHWDNGFKGQKWDGHLGGKNATVEKSINSKMAEWGEGSRGIVYVAWKSGGAHVFNVEYVGGKVVAYDAQTHNDGFLIMSYLKNSKPSKTMISRVDHLTEPTDYLKDAVRKKGG